MFGSAPTRHRKVTSSKTGRSGGRIFFSRVNFLVLTLIRCPSCLRVTAVARKRPRSFCQRAGGRLHINTHTPLSNRSRSALTMPLSRQSVKMSGNELTRNSSGNTRIQSSQLAELLWTHPGLKSGIILRELTST